MEKLPQKPAIAKINFYLNSNNHKADSNPGMSICSKTMMHIAYAPISPKYINFPLFSFFLAPLYFDHDAFTHHA